MRAFTRLQKASGILVTTFLLPRRPARERLVALGQSSSETSLRQAASGHDSHLHVLQLAH